ncbi:MBL fold metallo-hydrolase [Rhodospirillum rubrum]|uniref:MBL fold metallo-hydrolase n=1 Tax=Rhodospirillum rubrum TaxID=1085 RepID=UPI001904344C|nr:MBL fold metallo-hydrolase [Rhodospirillum rubrum]MBK1665319.1 MBL fold metallo-hydrolase [Rhodospirillum rubrum]MBK1676507.1 MBL fold metallo-hydrolase [Rhodospirillum rubrum]
MGDDLDFPFATPPAAGEAITVAPGVLWLRMPLPFALDHINLWAVEDGEGWTLIDTGVADDTTRALWSHVLEGPLGGRPVKRLICTHFHPDHMGLAGWLTDRFEVALWATLGEWTYGRMLALESDETVGAVSKAFYHRAGVDDRGLELVARRGNSFAKRVVPPPPTVRRIIDGEEIAIGGRSWRVIVGRGHAPEHAALWCPQAGVLISGDQVLPRISPNISVWPSEPDADPLSGFLESLGRFAPLPAETLVLPSHGRPFRGLHARIEALAAHHGDRLAEVEAACRDRALSAQDLLGVIFKRPLDANTVFFALGEALAHAHWLEGQGRLRRGEVDGVVRFTAIA